MEAPKVRDLSQPVRRFMGPVETTVRVDQTVGEALADLRRRTIHQPIVYFYTVDERGCLVGVVPSRSLLLGDPRVKVRDVMQTSVISVPAESKLDEALELFALYRLLALPVVDQDGRLIGALDVSLYAEELEDLAEANRRHDLFQLIGLTVEQARQRTPWAGFRRRLPWLLCNVAGGAVCAVLGEVYRGVLDEVVLIAMFIPLILTLSESLAMQSVTITLQFLHGRGTGWRMVVRRLWAEVGAGLMLGVVCGGLVWAGSLLFGEGSRPGVVIFVAVTGAMAIAAGLGTAVPVVLHAMHRDPRVAAGPVTLALTDVATMGTYLGLASWWLL